MKNTKKFSSRFICAIACFSLTLGICFTAYGNTTETSDEKETNTESVSSVSISYDADSAGNLSEDIVSGSTPEEIEVISSSEAPGGQKVPEDTGVSTDGPENTEVSTDGPEDIQTEFQPEDIQTNGEGASSGETEGYLPSGDGSDQTIISDDVDPEGLSDGTGNAEGQASGNTDINVNDPDASPENENIEVISGSNDAGEDGQNAVQEDKGGQEEITDIAADVPLTDEAGDPASNEQDAAPAMMLFAAPAAIIQEENLIEQEVKDKPSEEEIVLSLTADTAINNSVPVQDDKTQTMAVSAETRDISSPALNAPGIDVIGGGTESLPDGQGDKPLPSGQSSDNTGGKSDTPSGKGGPVQTGDPGNSVYLVLGMIFTFGAVMLMVWLAVQKKRNLAHKRYLKEREQYRRR